jgi:ABC-type antimicrobial peptide transport system permease subunit
MEMFTFPLKYGNKHALSLRNAVVLDEETAWRYFGDENPLGKQLSIIFNNKQKESFIVRGVAEEFPETASFGFSILVNYEKQFKLGLSDRNNWKQLTSATFIQLSHPENIHTITAGMNRYIELQNAANSLRPMSKLVFEPLRSMGRNTYKVRDSISHISLHPSQVIQLPISTLFLLLLACFNYMNISIVAAARRVKEIGIRKVVGGTRLQLVIQFIGENLLLCLIALPLGIAFTQYVILPAFNTAFGDFFNLSIMDFTSDMNLWFFLVGLLLLTGFSAGAYPAFYISAFQPTHIFKGSQTTKGKRVFTRILLAFQFVFSLIAVISGIVFTQNSIYQNNLDWGYNQEQVIVIPIESEYYTMYKDEIARHSNILSTAGCRMHIGKSYRQVVVKTIETETVGEANNYAVVSFDVGFDYVETMGLRLKEGRSFRRILKTDIDQAVIVNETFVNHMGWQNAMGKKVFLEKKTYQVIGVMEDFHYRVFTEKIEPALLRISPGDTFNYLAVKVRAGTAQQTVGFLQKTWGQVIPAAPYTGFFQDDVFAVYLQIMENLTIINIAWAIIFLFITCTGLFALVSLTITKRMKEISIRKVLGASLPEIIQLVTMDFIILIVIASVIALPTTYFLLNFLLDALIEYNVGVGPFALILAFVFVFAAALLTIFSRVYKAAASNPADNLRFE